MAGTKKPSRKHMKRGISPRQRAENAIQRGKQIAKARNEKIQQEVEESARAALASMLPPEAIAETFQPLYGVLDQIEHTGELDVVAGGVAVFYEPLQGGNFHLVSSLQAVADTFSLVCLERGGEDQGAGLRRLATKLDVDMPLMESDVAAARVSLDWMRDLSATMTVGDFIRISKQAQAPK